jgi:hypothetical protein
VTSTIDVVSDRVLSLVLFQSLNLKKNTSCSTHAVVDDCVYHEIIVSKSIGLNSYEVLRSNATHDVDM